MRAADLYVYFNCNCTCIPNVQLYDDRVHTSTIIITRGPRAQCARCQGAKRNRVDRVITLFSHPPNPVDLAEPCCPAFVWSSPYMHGARSTVHFLAEPCYIFSPVRASTLARAGLKIFPGARARVLN